MTSKEQKCSLCQGPATGKNGICFICNQPHCNDDCGGCAGAC